MNEEEFRMKNFMIVAVCMIVFGVSNLDAMKQDGPVEDPTEGSISAAAGEEPKAAVKSVKELMTMLVNLTKEMRETGCAAAQEAQKAAEEGGMDIKAAGKLIVAAGRKAVGGKWGKTYMQVRSQLPAAIIRKIKINDQIAEQDYFDGLTDDGPNKQFDTREEVLAAVAAFANLLVSQAEALATELDAA